MNAQHAEIIAFPLRRSFAEVREAARMIRSLDAKDGMSWWKLRARAAADQLRAIGMDEVEITAHILDFQTAVFTALAEIDQNDAEFG
jgi:hypothetical protein